MIKLFIFDYGRTLFDRESGGFFDDAHSVLEALSKRYQLAIVSYSKPSDVQTREQQLTEHGLRELFVETVFCDTAEGKDDAYQRVSEAMGVSGGEVAIVDDYVIRGVAWGNKHGAITYWFKNGKFSTVLPNNKTGKPTYTIRCLSDILSTLQDV